LIPWGKKGKRRIALAVAQKRALSTSRKGGKKERSGSSRGGISRKRENPPKVDHYIPEEEKEAAPAIEVTPRSLSISPQQHKKGRVIEFHLFIYKDEY